jgi:hypothetical protein
MSGVSSRATISEKVTAAATVSPNCRKNCPGMPGMKATGTKTARMAPVVAITAKPISAEASSAALYAPRSGWVRRWRTMFSISTMASSTSTPTTRVSASRVMLLSA